MMIMADGNLRIFPDHLPGYWGGKKKTAIPLQAYARGNLYGNIDLRLFQTLLYGKEA